MHNIKQKLLQICDDTKNRLNELSSHNTPWAEAAAGMEMVMFRDALLKEMEKAGIEESEPVPEKKLKKCARKKLTSFDKWLRDSAAKIEAAHRRLCEIHGFEYEPDICHG